MLVVPAFRLSFKDYNPPASESITVDASRDCADVVVEVYMCRQLERRCYNRVLVALAIDRAGIASNRERAVGAGARPVIRVTVNTCG
jgi:hypothetical protein